MTQELPKNNPRTTQERPPATQEKPKIDPRTTQERHKNDPKRPKNDLRTTQERSQEWPRSDPRMTQEWPKNDPKTTPRMSFGAWIQFVSLNGFCRCYVLARAKLDVPVNRVRQLNKIVPDLFVSWTEQVQILGACHRIYTTQCLWN
jgi:hypothetical protein